MNVIRKLIPFALLLFVFASCEKVIDIDLNEASPRLVVEGNVNNNEGPYSIKLSQTTNFFGPNVFPVASGAEIKIFDNAGNLDIMEEFEPGLYRTTTIQGVEGRNYQIEITYQNSIHTASGTIPFMVPIDSLTYTFKESQIFLPEGNYVTVYFKDPVAVKNYYMLKAYGTEINYNFGGGEQYIVFDDEFFSGEVTLELNQFSFEPGIAKIELYSITKAAYEYFNNLNELISGGGGGGNPFTGTPQNPITNISGGAMGFFGTYAIDADSLEIF